MDRSIRDVERALLAPIVLAHIAQDAAYGWGLIQAIEASHLAPVKQGTLYPLLARLEESGLVASSWRLEQDSQRPRRYYELTEAGRLELDAFNRWWLKTSPRLNDTFLNPSERTGK